MPIPDLNINWELPFLLTSRIAGSEMVIEGHLKHDTSSCNCDVIFAVLHVERNISKYCVP